MEAMIVVKGPSSFAESVKLAIISPAFAKAKPAMIVASSTIIALTALALVSALGTIERRTATIVIIIIFRVCQVFLAHIVVGARK